MGIRKLSLLLFILLLSCASAYAADGTAPGAITDLNYDYTGCVEGEVRLIWTAPTEDGTYGGKVEKYIIEYCDSSIDSIGNVIDWEESFAEEVTITPSPSNPGEMDSVIIASLTTGTTYYFGIRSEDEVPLTSLIDTKAQLGPPPQVSAIPQIDVTQPETITNLSAETGISSGKAILQWNAPGDDGGSGDITNGKYAIKYSTYPGIDWGGASNFNLEWTTTTSYGNLESTLVENLKSNTTYYFRLWTADELLNWSSLSNTATAWTLPDTESPSSIDDLGAETIFGREGTVNLTWTAAGDDGTKGNITDGFLGVKHSTNPAFNWGGASFDVQVQTSIVTGAYQELMIEGLNGGATYYFRLWTADEAEQWSGISSGATSWGQVDGFNPAAITDLTAQTHPIEEGTVNLSWTAPKENGLTGGKVKEYIIEHSISSIESIGTVNDWEESFAEEVTNPPLPSDPGVKEYFTISGLEYGATHYFAIRSKDEIPNKSQIDTKAATLLAIFQATAWTRSDPIAPSGVSDLEASYGGLSGLAILTWSAPGDDGTVKNIVNGKYGVKHSTDSAHNWGGASNFDLEWSTNAVTGQAQVKLIDELPMEATYYFRIWTADDGLNYSGISNSATTFVFFDASPPGVVTDLTAVSINEGEVELAWTAPGDDGTTGDLTVGWYGIKYSTEAGYDWGAPENFNLELSTSTNVGANESYSLTGLTNGATYYFRLWTADETEIYSGISNGATVLVMTDIVSPGIITDLIAQTGQNEGQIDLSWSAPGDNGILGLLTATSRFGIKFTTNASIDWGGPSGFTLSEIPAVSFPGQSFSLVPIAYSFEPGTTYYFRIWTCDDNENWSVISQGATAWAQVDVMVPAAVTDLIAQTGNNEGELKLTWTAPGDDGTVGTAYDYVVKHATYSAGASTTTWWNAADTYSQSWSPKGYGLQEQEVIHLTAGVTYYIIMRARDEAGNWSGISNEATSRVQADVEPPSAVVDLSADYGINEGMIDLSWTAPGDDGTIGDIINGFYGMKMSSYPSVAWNGPSGFNYIWNTTSTAKSVEALTVSGLTGGVTYYFRLWTADEILNWSGISSGATMWVQVDVMAPAVVDNLSAYTGTGEGDIELTWDAPGDDAAENSTTGLFRIKWSTDSAYSWDYEDFSAEISTNIVPGESWNYLKEGLDIGVTYYFRLWTADEALNWSGISVGATAWAQYDIFAPAGVTALASGTGDSEGEIDLSWVSPGDDGTVDEHPDGEYLLRYSTDSAHAWSEADLDNDALDSVMIDETALSYGQFRSHKLTGLAGGVTYYFRLWTADNRNNWSGISNSASAIAQVDVEAPSEVDDLAAAAGDNEGDVRLIWTAPGDDGTLNNIVGGNYGIKISTYESVDWGGPEVFDVLIPTNTTAGTAENKVITGLSTGVTHYFRVWTSDELDNWSAFSNMAFAVPRNDFTAPSAITDLWGYPGSEAGDLHLCWTAVGDDGMLGDITGGYYRVQYSTNPDVILDKDDISVVEVSTDTSAGQQENMLIQGLLPGVTYYFGVWTADETGNFSGVSNKGSAMTREVIERLDVLDNSADLTGNVMTLLGAFGVSTQTGTFILENQGNVDLDNVVFYPEDLSDGGENTIPLSDISFDVNGSTYIPVISYAAGSNTATVNVVVTIPGGLELGLYSGVVTVQDDDGQPIDSFTLQLSFIGPDLIVKSLEYSPQNPEPGTEVDVVVIIENQGDVAVTQSNFWTDFYKDLASQPEPGFVGDESWEYAGLQAHSTMTFTTSFIYQGETLSMYALVDSDLQVIEYNDANNTIGPVSINPSGSYGYAAGTVMNKLDGGAVVGAEVSAWKLGSMISREYTDNSGQYTLMLSPYDEYEIRAWAINYSSSAKTGMTITENQTLEPLNYLLSLEDQDASFIAGTVLKQDLVNPVQNALIELLLNGTTNVISSGNTQQDGSYRLIVSSGIYYSRVSAQGYETVVSTSYTVMESSSVVIDFTMSSSGVQPHAVEGLSAYPLESEKIYLEWDTLPVASVDYYRVYYSSGALDLIQLYSVVAATVADTSGNWTSPVLERGQDYSFSVRAVNDSEVENNGVDVIVTVKAVGMLAGVKAEITTPGTGIKVSGGFAMLMAEIVQGSTASVSKVVFEYKRYDRSVWNTVLTIGQNDVHENPDTSYPYFIHWDISGIVEMEYNLRAVAYDTNGNPDLNPSSIVVSKNSVDFDVEEQFSGDTIVKTQKLANWKSNTILINGFEDDKFVTLIVPPDSLDEDNVKITVTLNPSGVPDIPLKLGSIGKFYEITLQNGNTTLENNNLASLELHYDYNGTEESLLSGYRYSDTIGEWEAIQSELDIAENKIVTYSNHFSVFGILYTTQASSYDDLIVYPNPFKPEHLVHVDGITFENLTENTSVSIYTIAGDIVWKAEDIDDNDVTWELKNAGGSLVASGVYIYVISNDNSETVTGKVAVIK